MKQKLLLILGIMFMLIISASAQSFMFYRGDQPLDDNAEFTVSDYKVAFVTADDFTVLSMESGLKLKNITNRDVQTTVTQTILEAPSDTLYGYLSFCFLECTTGNSNKTMSGNFPANSFSVGYHSNFYVYLGKYNRVKVKYEAYLTGNPADKKTVTVTYVYDKNSTTQLNKPIVNPAFNVFQEGDQVKFNYSFDSNACRLEIYNLQGQKIAQHLLPTGAGTFILSEKLNKGIYLCVVKDEKQTFATQKFIVK